MSLGRVQLPTLLVLEALLVQDTEIHGWAVVTHTRLSPGTVYPILQRLEDIGWVTSRWDNAALPPAGPPAGRPPRRAARRYFRFVEAHRLEAATLVTARLAPYRDTPHSH